MTSPGHARLLARPRGFTLIEIVVVLLIFALIVAMAAAITRGVVAAQKRSTTATRIATVEAALVQFVLQQKRLPCPADGTLLSSDANAGIERGVTAGGCTVASLQDGVVPWRTLALTETDASDGWDRRLTYRLDPSLGATNGMDLSWCDPAGAEPIGAPPRACTVGTCSSTSLATCTPPIAFLRGRGLLVKNVAGTVLMDPAPAPSIATPTGAAYVVISPGESGGGGYLSSGQLGVSTVGDGTEEMKNYASLPFASLTVTYYVDDSLAEVLTNLHFDDVVARPSVLSVASKAGLAPRSH